MKLSLVNLVPLKEVEFDSPAPEGMDIPNFDSLVDALKWKNDLENYSMDLEHELKHAQRQFNDKLSGQEERGAEPEGGPIQQKIAGELNQLKAREEELKQKLNTVLAKVDYFDQNYLSENLNEAKIKSKEEFDKRASAEQKAMEKKWDSLDTTIKFKKEDPKQHTANMEAKQEYLTNLNKAGKLKTDYSDDKLENWSIESSLFGWDIASTVLKTPKSTTEGSCGYGPDGVPGDTPGGTKGMPADDRTRGMLRMLIQKEVAKLNENENFDARMQAAGNFSDKEMGDITSRDIGSPFPGTDKVSDGYKAARALIDELRYVTYKKLSDDERDAFTKEMVGHFIETTQGMAAAKAAMARKGL